jgi:BirA family biotin operon repressor/biotin-[acetyl-CoA-carboxylase] ligase
MIKTLFTGHIIRYLDRVDSTNNFAAKMITEGKFVEGTVIVADAQTSGKGRLTNRWQSEEGANLLCSFIFKPHFIEASQSYLLNMLSALAVHRVLNENGIENAIKWPNDLVCKNLKISGILIENQIRGSLINAAIIGIGINTNQVDFPVLGATSMALQAERNFKRDELLFQLCNYLEAAYLNCRSNPQPTIDAYNGALYARDEVETYCHNGRMVEAKLRSVLPNGLAVFELKGNAFTADMDEMRLVRTPHQG